MDRLINEFFTQASMTTEVLAAHILVSTLQEANDLLVQINDGAGFDTLAREHSSCPSSGKGGVLGWFGRGRMVKEFEDAAFKLKKGEVSTPIHTQFGYHLIKCIDQR